MMRAFLVTPILNPRMMDAKGTNGHKIQGIPSIIPERGPGRSDAVFVLKLVHVNAFFKMPCIGGLYDPYLATHQLGQ